MRDGRLSPPTVIRLGQGDVVELVRRLNPLRRDSAKYTPPPPVQLAWAGPVLGRLVTSIHMKAMGQSHENAN